MANFSAPLANATVRGVGLRPIQVAFYANGAGCSLEGPGCSPEVAGVSNSAAGVYTITFAAGINFGTVARAVYVGAYTGGWALTGRINPGAATMTIEIRNPATGALTDPSTDIFALVWVSQS